MSKSNGRTSLENSGKEKQVYLHMEQMLEDSKHLTTVETGVYYMAVLAMPCPLDQLFNKIKTHRVTLAEFESTWPKISGFFDDAGETLISTRIRFDDPYGGE